MTRKSGRQVSDYQEGWYTADTAHMEQSLHPELAKPAYLPGFILGLNAGSVREAECENPPVARDIESARGGQYGHEMPQPGERVAGEYLLPGVAAKTVQLFVALGADDPDDRVSRIVACGDDRGPCPFKLAHQAV